MSLSYKEFITAILLNRDGSVFLSNLLILKDLWKVGARTILLKEKRQKETRLEIIYYFFLPASHPNLAANPTPALATNGGSSSPTAVPIVSSSV